DVVMHLSPRLHGRGDEPLVAHLPPVQRAAARPRMIDNHFNMHSLAPELLDVAARNGQMAGEESNVELPRPDRAQMLAPAAVLNIELDARIAAPIGSDQLPHETPGQRRDDADAHLAFLDPAGSAGALQHGLGLLENRDDVVE